MVVQHTVVPRLSLSQVLTNWPRIRARLMENARKRRLQINVLIEKYLIFLFERLWGYSPPTIALTRKHSKEKCRFYDP